LQAAEKALENDSKSKCTELNASGASRDREPLITHQQLAWNVQAVSCVCTMWQRKSVQLPHSVFSQHLQVAAAWILNPMIPSKTKNDQGWVQMLIQ